MLRCSNDTNSVMGLTLTQIGLLLASGILLTVVFSFVFSNDWQRTAELQAQASSFSNLLGDIDNSFFERTTRFQFSHTDYAYSVKISTEYIVITSKGFWDGDLIVTKRLLLRPWPRIPQQNWTTGEDLHNYLNRTCGHRGTENDSMPAGNFTQLCQEQNDTTSSLALHPLEILIKEPVFTEKVTIFYDQTKRHDFLLLYQLS
ncbi:MAG: hypothetical protein NTY91_03320 [Euryarchaeota archaeon]|nr:hypothetical protein [Euryarchaeota archaeon]